MKSSIDIRRGAHALLLSAVIFSMPVWAGQQTAPATPAKLDELAR